MSMSMSPSTAVLVVLLVAVAAVRESAAAATIITTDADGRINCDGLKCPAGNGVSCMTSADTANGVSTVYRRCVDAAGQTLLQDSYTTQSPGMAFGRQSSMAIMFKN